MSLLPFSFGPRFLVFSVFALSLSAHYFPIGAATSTTPAPTVLSSPLLPSLRHPRRRPQIARIQITAEQILREARECLEAEIRPSKQKIADAAELGDYRLQKRKEFEDLIRRRKKVWVKYARWEESQGDFNRARSVYERALQIDYKDHTLWLKYADFEMRNKFVNHARNVLDRATQLLPRICQLWFKYIRMEKTLGNLGKAEELYRKFAASEFDKDREGIEDAIADKRRLKFEKEEEGIEDAIVGKRRFLYEDKVRRNPLNYDAWCSHGAGECVVRCSDDLLSVVY